MMENQGEGSRIDEDCYICNVVPKHLQKGGRMKAKRNIRNMDIVGMCKWV